MANQVKIRNGTAAQCAAMTPVASEVINDTTNNRLRVGNGSTAGGIILPNSYDTQNNPFCYAAAGGTANALTATFTPAPTAYAAGQRFLIKAAYTNTGAATINVNSLGAKNIYKSSGGSIGALAAGDIISGGMYELAYDGTQFQVISSAAPAVTTPGLVLLDTQTASGSSQLDFTTGVSSTYKSYLMKLEGIVMSSGAANLLLRMRVGGSVDATHGNYKTLVNFANDFGAYSQLKEVSAYQAGIIALYGYGGILWVAGGEINITAPSGQRPVVNTDISRASASGTNYIQGNHNSGSYNGSTSQVDGFRLIPSGGTITSGSVKLYGIKAS